MRFRRYMIYLPLIIAATYLGGHIGHRNREYFPYVTRYVHHTLGTENEFTKKSTAIAGGVTAGVIGGSVLALLIEHYINRTKKSN